MEKLNTKVQRFLELSKEFTAKSSEVYGDSFYESNYITINSNGLYTSNIISHGIPVEAPTKLEQFEIAQKEKIEKAKRYEEYLELQTELSNYYTALNKIENN